MTNETKNTTKGEAVKFTTDWKTIGSKSALDLAEILPAVREAVEHFDTLHAAVDAAVGNLFEGGEIRRRYCVVAIPGTNAVNLVYSYRVGVVCLVGTFTL